MKELSIEEKAKAYDEALEVAQRFYKNSAAITKKGLEDMFPELAESEDERIRKYILKACKETIEADDKGLELSMETTKKLAAYLEKQGEKGIVFRDTFGYEEGRQRGQEEGIMLVLDNPQKYGLEKQCEQKPADKVEPKFKVGDWVVRNGETLQISGIDTMLDGTFHYWFTKGTWLSSKKMENAILWTIQDAKDGDVLVASDGSIFLFKGTIDYACKHYVALTTDGAVKFNEGLEHYWETSTAVHPATKEQRDLLFSKMKETGYRWNQDEKKLEEIKQKSAEWSEEDERIFQIVIDILDKEEHKGHLSHTDLVSCVRKLKSLKDRVYPQQHEWSDEDEATFTVIGSLILDNFSAEDASKTLTWLHSLTPHPQWKPSDKQIEALDFAVDCIVPDAFCFKRKELKELLEQLKRLREE